MEYNYRHFKPKYYMFEEFSGPRPGQKALDFSARTLEGKTAHLSEFFDKPIVLETGSITCPVFTGKIDRMNQFVRQYPDTQFIVLYVREAHPGTKISCHGTEEEKDSNARRLKDETGDNRLILVDDLEGTAHKKYGLFPDMVYVIDQDGTVVYRARWNDLDELGKVLKAMSEGNPLPNTESERFVNPPKPSLMKFATGGWDALFDFLVGFPRLIFHDFIKRK